MNNSLPAIEAKDRDEFQHRKVIDDFSWEKENGTIDSSRKEDQDGLSHQQNGWEKDASSLSSETYDKGKEWRSLEHESFVKVEEFTDFTEDESQDSSSPCNCASDLSETDASLFTDKNVLDCELPELEVLYKEIDYHVVKDICVDEGRPEKDKNLTKSCRDDVSCHLFAQSPDDKNHSESTEVLSLKDATGLCAKQCGGKEESDGKLIPQRRLKSSSDSSFDEDMAKDCNPAKLVQRSETNCSSTGKAALDNSEKDSLMDKKLPIQEFDARSSLRSFLYPLHGEENVVTQQPDQILDGKAVSQSPAASSVEAGRPEEDVQASSISYNSKVENGSITFNFNSPVPVVGGMTNGVTENLKQQSVGSGDVHKDTNVDNLSDVRQVQCSTSSVENVHEQSLIIKGGNSDSCSATINVDCLSSKDRTDENVHAEDNSKEWQVEFPSNKNRRSANDDEEGVEQNVWKNEHRSCDATNVSVVSQLQYDEGETSFSAASYVAYSGQIAFSGSISHRSDGSATSGRSFAFPILQSEWHSSPVRMAKADKRHKGWRSGLLCCRF